MSRIYTNTNSIAAQTALRSNQMDLNTRLARLSSGLRIKAGKDDPAGLIASETLRSEMAGIQQAISNSQRASSVISTAEGALNEVSALLLDIKSLINNSANEGGLAPEEIEANQDQIDSAIASIDRIANSTQFEGVKLLDGNMDFVTTGVDGTQIADLKINEVRFGTAASVAATIETQTAAEKGTLLWSATGAGATLAAATTIEVKGNKGVEVFSFGTGTTTAEMVTAINQARDVTGVSAAAVATEIKGAGTNAGINFSSTDFGAKQFVSVEKVNGAAFSTVLNVAGYAAATRDAGVDAVVTVNGVTAVAEGLNIKVGGPTLWFEAKLDATNMNTANDSTTFTVTGGGALFQLGQDVNAQQQSIVGIQSVAAHRLGNAAEGYLRDIKTGGSESVIAGNYQDASEIIDAAIAQVATMRGRLGAFQKNTLDTTMNSLNVALENVTASESAIRDADFAKETAALTRAQILVQAGTSVLSIANSSPQNVLALLG
ncbi:MAG: flagellin [Planctomycetes bacterium]|nr:flagellin [Planctomycetota bacterium]